MPHDQPIRAAAGRRKVTQQIKASADVLAVLNRAAGDATGNPIEAGQAYAAIVAFKELLKFNKTLVLNGRQKFNATPEQIALSDAAEAALTLAGGAA